MTHLNDEAAALASAMRGGTMDAAMRARFIAFRTKLYRLGLYDPVLGRFDSHTVTQSTPAEVADQLDALAASL
ncbi:MAG: hypothetical protein ACYC7A_01695 [Thermoanaerobaculia bacterium]